MSDARRAGRNAGTRLHWSTLVSPTPNAAAASRRRSCCKRATSSNVNAFVAALAQPSGAGRRLAPASSPGPTLEPAGASDGLRRVVSVFCGVVSASARAAAHTVFTKSSSGRAQSQSEAARSARGSGGGGAKRLRQAGGFIALSARSYTKAEGGAGCRGSGVRPRCETGWRGRGSALEVATYFRVWAGSLRAGTLSVTARLPARPKSCCSSLEKNHG